MNSNDSLNAVMKDITTIGAAGDALRAQIDEYFKLLAVVQRLTRDIDEKTAERAQHQQRAAEVRAKLVEVGFLA